MVLLDPAVITGGDRVISGAYLVASIILFSSSFLLTYVLHFWGTALPSQALRASSPRDAESTSPFGEVALRSNDGEGEAVSHKRKGPVSQRTKSPERREPVISVTGHPWYHSLCCAKSTAAPHDRLFEANRCPYNGGLPSGPTVCFSPAAQGPVTETLCTALHHPAALCTQKKIVFPRQRICALFKVVSF